MPNKSLFKRKLCNFITFSNNLIQCEQCQKTMLFYYCTDEFYNGCDSFSNIGTEVNPLFNCSSCQSYGRIIMTDEFNINHCNSDSSYERCEKGILNTFYYNDLFTCTKCKSPYFLSHIDNSCKGIYEDEIYNNKNKNLINCGVGFTYFYYLNKCLNCKDLGCEGQCRYDEDKGIVCESGKCLGKFFEIEPNICDLCSSILKGCENCSYTEDIDSYTEDIFEKLFNKRRRRLICNSCLEGFMFQDGKCIPCNLTNCEKCIVENNQFKCIKPYIGYYIDEKGILQKCESSCHNCSLDINNKLKCDQALFDSFIDNDGKSKFCSDVIDNCFECQLIDSQLKCNYCKKDYELSDNKCISIRENYNLTGCEYILDYDNGSYSCSLCQDDYFLILNQNKCMKKTEETKLCEKSISIKENDYYIYNCTECSSGKLIKNLTGHYYCYELTREEIIDMNCAIILNIGTLEEPYFVCEKCIGNDILVIDEYGNQKCMYDDYSKCSRYNKTKYLSNFYTLKYDYIFNCTECIENYALIYNERNGLMKCKSTCDVINCQKCQNYSVYVCSQCFSGYKLNIIGYNGFCSYIPPYTPSIIFKDLFRFALNGVFFINGNDLFGPIFYLRGISRDNIDAKHSFLISTIFSRINSKNLRELEEINLKTYCEFRNEVYNNFSDIKEVDYECFIDKGNSSLEEYNISSLKTMGKETELNLNVKGLDDIIKKSANITHFISSYNNEELKKYIEFYINEITIEININNDTGNQTFVIKGVTNKEMENNLTCILTFSNSNRQANCLIEAKNKENATMTCISDFSNFTENYTDNIFGFEENELIDEKNYFYLIGIKNIQFEYNILEQQSSIIYDTNLISSSIITQNNSEYSEISSTDLKTITISSIPMAETLTTIINIDTSIPINQILSTNINIDTSIPINQILSTIINIDTSIPMAETLTTIINIDTSIPINQILSTNINMNSSNSLIPPQDQDNILEEHGKVIFLGISNYMHIKQMKLGTFILYFVQTKSKTKAKELILNISIIYKSLFRILQSTNTETAKCKPIDNNIENIIKYNCSFNTTGEDIDKIQINNNNIYFVGQNISISSISPLALKYMNNLQDCNNDKNIFDKKLYILNNSELIQNNNVFNITGELIGNELNNKNINLELILLSENKEENIENVSCAINKLNQNNNNYRLICTCNEEMVGDINNSAFSMMENENLLVLFKDNKNYHLNYTNIQYQRFNRKSNKKGLSAGYIVLIIVASLIGLSIITIFMLLAIKKYNANNNINQERENTLSIKTSSMYVNKL